MSFQGAPGVPPLSMSGPQKLPSAKHQHPLWAGLPQLHPHSDAQDPTTRQGPLSLELEAWEDRVTPGPAVRVVQLLLLLFVCLTAGEVPTAGRWEHLESSELCISRPLQELPA